MKAIRKRFKKGTAVALTAALLAGLVPALPGAAGSVKAAGGTTKSPSVSTYATKEQMMDGTFKPNSEGSAWHYGRLLFGKNSSGRAQEWYILGQDKGVLEDNTILFATSPIAREKKFNSNENNKNDSNLWSDCNYGGVPVTEVFANHYGASDLRAALKTMATSTSYFTIAEQYLMNATTVTTKDAKNENTYTTTDKLYALAADGVDSTSIKVGTGDSTVIAMSSYMSSYPTFWLRSPHGNDGRSALVAKPDDRVYFIYVDRDYAVRPASNLNLSSVLFASAAKAASSDTAVTDKITFSKAMTLRLDGSGKNIGTVTYNATTGDIKVVRGDTSQPVSLVVQGNDGTDDWYYSKQIAGSETINVSAITSESYTPSSIDLSACKIWLETTDSTENLTYAVSATEATRSSISSVAITDIETPVANTTLDTSASCVTTGVSSTTPQITWTPSATTAGYNTSYTASIILTAAAGCEFTDSTTATINGNTATSVNKNTDGTLTVTYAFPATAKDKLVSITSPQAITVANGTAYDAMNLPATVSIATEGNTVSSAPVTWDTTTPASGSYDPAVLTEQTVTLNGMVDCPESIDANGTALTTTLTITISAAGIVGAPTANPTAGIYTENQSVTLTSSTKGATIYYTTDGSEPTITGGTTKQYTAPIAVTGTEGQSVQTTIKAIAVKSGMQDSSVETFNYTIKQESQTPGVTAPSITTQPGNATVEVGETASFNIVASGTNLTYQWQIDRNDGKGWVNIDGATATSYTTSAVDISCNGFKYQCVVSNSVGKVTSNTAVLTATEPAPTEHTHCACGTNNLSTKGHSCNKNQVWTGIDDLSEITSGGYYYLKQDVTITSTNTYSSVYTSGNQYCGLKISDDVALCLNGHSIIMQNPEGVTDDVDAVMVEGHFALTDCQGMGTIKHAKDSSSATYQGKGVKVQGGTFDMYGGTITGNTSEYDTGGSGVSVVGVEDRNKSSIFHMYGGTISGNIAKNGGGVEVTRSVYNGPSEFHMYGGTITGNTADSTWSSYGNGGGVYVSWTAKFFMNGGKICGNTATYQGGGVYGSALARYNEYDTGGAAELNVSGSATVTDNKAGTGSGSGTGSGGTTGSTGSGSASGGNTGSGAATGAGNTTGTGGTTGGTTGSGTGSGTGVGTTPSTPTAGITNVQPNSGTPAAANTNNQATQKTTVNAKAPVTGEATPVSCMALAFIIVGGFALLIVELRRSRQTQKKR